MPASHNISFFIITKNEEERLAKALESIQDIAAEIIIVDSGSTDNTEKIAKSFSKVKWYYNEWPGYGAQKKFAESLCKNSWVFNIDADEQMSPDLAKELSQIMKNGQKYDAYKVNIKIKPRFHHKIPLFGPKDCVIRFYNKEHCSYSEHPIHDSVQVGNKQIGMLQNHLEHECFKSYAHAVNKINGYTDMQAENLFKRGKNPSSFRIIFEPLFAFCKSYFLNKYIFLGLEGFIEAVIYSFNRTLRLAKAREKFLNGKNK